MNEDIKNLIPHRAPFLFADDIESIDEKSIVVKKHITGEEDFFKGHYPEQPIMPGVLLCECCFQAGALYIAKQVVDVEAKDNKVPVVTRMNNVKFKNPVFPDSHLEISVSFDQVVSTAYYFKGSIKSNGKKILSLDFCCTVTEIQK